MQKSRRDFLISATSTAATGLLAGCSSIDRIIFEPEQQSLVEVVIVGAGLAGLTAALELKKRSIPYTIFEASPRLGGRVLSRRELNSAGEPVTLDLGMATFSELDLPVLNLTKELKVQTSQTSNKNEFKIDQGFSQLIEALQRRVSGIPEERFLKISSAINSITLDGEFFNLSYIRETLVQSRRSTKVIMAVPPSQIAGVLKNLGIPFAENIIKFSQGIGMEDSRVAGFNWNDVPFVKGGRSIKSASVIIPDSDFFYLKQGEKAMAVIGDYTDQRYFGRGSAAIKSAQDAVGWILS